MKSVFKILMVVLLGINAVGCASIAKKWKGLIGGGSSEEVAKTTEDGKPLPPTSYQNNPNYGSFKERQYKKVTVNNFSEDQMLEENAGSLWKAEGQGSYLFSQNSLRVLGDIINVGIEGKALENLNVKVDLIKKAQAKLDIPSPKSLKESKIPRPEDRSTANVPAPAQPTAAVATAEKPVEDTKENIKFDPVPCRIVEKNPDGSYRVKGVQVVYVGKKEFKLMVTGSVKPDDISTDAINSSRLIDSRYDLVAKDGSK